jgi:hypothetical protein
MTLEHEHILGELDNRHPAASSYVDGTNDLHVLLRNTVYTDSPIWVPRIALPQAQLKEREKKLRISGDDNGRSENSLQRICRRKWRRVS